MARDTGPSPRAALGEYLARARGVVSDPERIVVVNGTQQALDLMKDNHISGIPVVERAGDAQPGKLVGILTNRDVRFATDPRQNL